MNGIDNAQTFANVTNEWTDITFDFSVATATEYSFKICGGMQAAFVQPYDISGITLTKIG